VKIKEDAKTTYVAYGQLFFASTLKFIDSFDFTEKIKSVNIDLFKAKVWDESVVDAIDKVAIKFHRNGIKTNLIGMSNKCLELVDRMGIHNKPSGLEVSNNH
jgi:SulP family sulfate permease